MKQLDICNSCGHKPVCEIWSKVNSLKKEVDAVSKAKSMIGVVECSFFLEEKL